MNPAAEIADQKAKMEALEQITVDAVNFEAYVMETCLTAAKALVGKQLLGQGHTTHGPDEGPGAEEHPATSLIANSLYREVRQTMREGPGGKKSSIVS